MHEVKKEFLGIAIRKDTPKVKIYSTNDGSTNDGKDYVFIDDKGNKSMYSKEYFDKEFV